MSDGPRLGSGQAFYEDKAALYVNGSNSVVVSRVRSCLPVGGRILDIGCGSGGLLHQVADVAGYRAGVELSSVAAAAASQIADKIFVGPLSTDLPFAEQSFDVVVCADVLEHLSEPEEGLSAALAYCKPGGRIVVSVPNVANWEARLRLLRGVWRYEPVGLFDSGHLRFFTRSTLLALLEGAGLVVESCVPARLPRLTVQVPMFARLPRPIRLGLNGGWVGVGNILALCRPTLFAYQLVCTARRPS